MQDIRFVQLLAVTIDLAIAQVNAIARHPHNPFHHVRPSVGCIRMQKHNDVAAPHLTVRKQWSRPRSLRRELNPVYKHVIPDQQRVLHGTGGDLEGLHHKRDDEQSRYQHRRQRGQKLHRSLAWFFLDFVFRFVVFLSQYVSPSKS